MKAFTAICAFLLCALFFSGSLAVPVADIDEGLAVGLSDVDAELFATGSTADVEEVPIRQKRATCDALSIFNVNHSACAAHCILKRYKGGYCNSRAVCVCRR